MDARITKMVKDDEAYIDLYWSSLKMCSKYEVQAKVPALPGIYELYLMDKYSKLNLFKQEMIWYSGLRQALRHLIDPLDAFDPDLASLIKKEKTYFRYTTIENYADLLDVYYFLHVTRYPDRERPENSSRYIGLYLKEHSPNKIVTT